MEWHESDTAENSSPAGAASALINREVKEVREGGRVSYRDLAERIEQGAQEQEHAPESVRQYVDALRHFSHDAMITTLPEGVGGQFDGSSVEIATSTVEVDTGGVTQAIARMEETMRHEAYHAVHHHTEVAVAPDASISTIMVGEGLNTEQFIEGLTVAQTGNRFISDEYRQYEQKVRTGVRRAGLTLEEAERELAA
ncbi:MAG: hypothetical protein PHS73_00380 [Candidatus Peribacteraceae bacterium]|nr:hypothetical protein [Candidatus Peribacteraceae bacterium]